MKKEEKPIIVDISDNLEIVESAQPLMSVEQILSQYPGLTKVSKTNVVNLTGLRKSLDRVKGQDDSIEVIWELIKNWIRKARKKKPLVLMLAGSSGTGKTYTAKQIHESLAVNGYKFVRLNMNEYQNQADIWKLLGSSTGYSGSTDDSPLFAARKMSEKLVILFDEIEKAHSSLFTAIMGLMDEGLLANGRGEEYDFSQSIIVFTTNLAMDLLIDAKRRLSVQGITIDDQQFQNEMEAILKKAGMRNEICGRIGCLLVYNTFGESDVIDLTLDQIRMKAGEYEIRINGVSQSYLESVAARCANNNEGARPIEKIVEREIEPFLQDVYEDGKIDLNQLYDIVYENGKFNLAHSASPDVKSVDEIIN